MTRLERASAQLSEALNNFLAAVAAELAEARATVAPHSHPLPLPVQLLLARHEGATAADLNSLIVTAQASKADDRPLLAPEKAADAPAAASAPAVAPLPKPTAAKKPILFTAERLALIERDYTAGVPISEIAKRITALPGAPLTDPRRIAIAAAARGWRRPAAGSGRTSQAVAPATDPPPAVAAKEAQPAAPPAAKPAPKPPAAEVAVTPAPKPVSMAATKAPPSPPAPIDLNCWTPKRLEVAQPLYEAGAPLLDIAVACNGLNGPIVTIQKIQVLAAARGWKRSATKPVSTDPVIADDAEIRHWAGQRGIVAQGRALPLEVINAKRLALGMPPFQRATQRGRAA